MQVVQMLALIWLVFFVGILWDGYPLSTAIIDPSIVVGFCGAIAAIARLASFGESEDA